jgi:hypothetical protein
MLTGRIDACHKECAEAGTYRRRTFWAYVVATFLVVRLAIWSGVVGAKMLAKDPEWVMTCHDMTQEKVQVMEAATSWFARSHLSPASTAFSGSEQSNKRSNFALAVY